LAAAGIKETVLLAYVDRSESSFDLEADEIIHLNDLGVPASVVSAMLKRDTVLRNLEGAGTGGLSATGPVTTIPVATPSGYREAKAGEADSVRNANRKSIRSPLRS